MGLFGAADALRTEIGSTLQPNDQEFNDRCIADLRVQLGEAAFTAAWESGAAMSPDEATVFAVRTSPSTTLRHVAGPQRDDD